MRFEFALVNQPAAERLIRVAVLVGVTNPNQLAVWEFNAARTLNLQEHQLNWIVDPCNGGGGLRAFAGNNFSGGVIRHHAIAFESPAQSHARQTGIHLIQLDRQHVIGRWIQRVFSLCVGFEIAFQQRLVIPRNQTTVFIAVAELIGLKVVFEVLPNRCIILGIDLGAGAAHIFPAAAFRQCFAAALPAGPCTAQVAGLPFGELAKAGAQVARLHFAAINRFFDGCGARRNKQGRTECRPPFPIHCEQSHLHKKSVKEPVREHCSVCAQATRVRLAAA